MDNADKKDLTKELLYISYATQRDEWFDPNHCTDKMYDDMNSLFPDMQEFEERYQKEMYGKIVHLKR